MSVADKKDAENGGEKGTTFGHVFLSKYKPFFPLEAALLLIVERTEGLGLHGAACTANRFEKTMENQRGW